MAVDPETMEELLADVEAGERALRPFRPGEVLVDLGGRVGGRPVASRGNWRGNQRRDRRAHPRRGRSTRGTRRTGGVIDRSRSRRSQSRWARGRSRPTRLRAALAACVCREPRQCRGPGGRAPAVLRALVGKRLPLKVIEADQPRPPDPVGEGRRRRFACGGERTRRRAA